MSEHKPSFIAQIKSYPAQFWVANTMEIFERMSWYGWFTVMALYVTGSVETGGLGFSTETRGALQAIVPFFLYLFPVFTGAIADRYGFKRTFVVAYVVMIISYYMLGQFSTLPTFFMAFMFVAVGAALFKPVVVGTVAKVTDDSNSSTGFGIFYMMVNIGGFVGPIVAGIVRGWGWQWVFVACSFWALVNLIIVLIFYREPLAEASQRQGRFSQVLDNMVEVLGNVRFFVTVFAILFALMFANLRVGIFAGFTWTHAAIFIPAWVILNFVWDRFLPANSGPPESKGGISRPAFLRRMYCSNWRFALFLLIMSGFWTAFNQIFYTMPEYIRDFVDTDPMVAFLGGLTAGKVLIGAAVVLGLLFALAAIRRNAAIAVAGGFATFAFVVLLIVVQAGALSSERTATINELERAEIQSRLSEVVQGPRGAEALREAASDLRLSKIRVGVDELDGYLVRYEGDIQGMTDAVIADCRQMNPEFIVNIDALAIVIFQVLISFLMARFHRFTTMIVGMIVAAVGIGLSAFAGGEGAVGIGASVWVVALGLFIFAIGEMMASPTSQEYVGRIAPKDKKALYMGYYFVAVALGNLFGGILSGELYGKFARDMQRPDYMWLTFGGLMLLTAVVFMIYNKMALPREQSHTLTP